MQNNSISFVRVTTKEVNELINSANTNIIFAKPAFLINEINVLLNTVKEKNITAKIYMEAGDKAIRYGFGETEALKLLDENNRSIDVHLVERLRIAILIVDDRALVYMPNFTFIEEESSELSFSNGFLCSREVTDDIIEQFSVKSVANINEKIEKLGNVIILPGGFIPIKGIDDVKSDIRESLENLKNR